MTISRGLHHGGCLWLISHRYLTGYVISNNVATTHFLQFSLWLWTCSFWSWPWVTLELMASLTSLIQTPITSWRLVCLYSIMQSAILLERAQYMISEAIKKQCTNSQTISQEVWQLGADIALKAWNTLRSSVCHVCHWSALHRCLRWTVTIYCSPTQHEGWIENISNI